MTLKKRSNSSRNWLYHFMRNPAMTLLFVFLVILLLASCSKFGTTAKGSRYKCTDGREVTNLSDCEAVNLTRNVTRIPQNVTMAPPVLPENVTPERNYTTLRKKNGTEEAPPSYESMNGSLADLNGWSVQEIVDGMAAYDESLSGMVAGTIKYDPKDPSHYWIGNNQLAKVYDPFWIARSAFAGGVKEYETNHFRISLAQSPKEFMLYVDTKRNDSKFKLLYPELWKEWDAVNCSMINSCRNIEAVACLQGNHTLWMWTHNTPGPGYTETTRYTMQAFDDDKKTLTAFEKFYCTPV